MIGYRCSRDVDDYFQESGRVGRDGKQSHAILFNYKGNFGKGKTDKAMHEYVNSTDKCRRELLLKHYEQQSSTPVKHLCSDVCSKICMCGESGCNDEERGMSEIKKKMAHATLEEPNNKSVCREANGETRDIIRDLLRELQTRLVTEDKL